METVREIRRYEQVLTKDLWKKLVSEEEARRHVWKLKFGDAGFSCRRCQSSKYWEHHSKTELRTCKSCGTQHRVRAGTIFEHSKLPLLKWFEALYFVMQDKRGVSCLQLKRMLGLSSMGTAWLMLMKIRKALSDRDAHYQLDGVIELDGAYFVKDPELVAKGYEVLNKKKAVFVAVEQKQWTDDKGRTKSRAGFAKVYMDENLTETKESAEKFIKQSIKLKATLKTDGKIKTLSRKSDAKALSGDRKLTEEHLPWVHKFISNAKTWILGTHHGRIESKYLRYYLAEYTYRFNRRHDPNSLFYRALSACVLSAPLRAHALTGNA
jgi:transposase-like protein